MSHLAQVVSQPVTPEQEDGDDGHLDQAGGVSDLQVGHHAPHPPEYTSLFNNKNNKKLSEKKTLLS